MKLRAKAFLEGTFMCASSFLVCTRTRTQLRGNIAHSPTTSSRPVHDLPLLHTHGLTSSRDPWTIGLTSLETHRSTSSRLVYQSPYLVTSLTTFKRFTSAHDMPLLHTHGLTSSRDTWSYCIVLYSSIYIAPLNSHRQTEALLVRLAPRKETSFKK